MDGDCQGRYIYGLSGFPEPNGFLFIWSARTDALTVTLANRSLDCTLVFGGFAQELADAHGWTLAQAGAAMTQVSALALTVDGRQTGAGVALSEVALDEVSLGGFAPAPGIQRSWTISGYDLDAGGNFVVEGSLDLMGSFGTCIDTCDVEIAFGTLASGNADPTVSVGGADVLGSEGSLLSASGSFVDPDGDPLTIEGSGDGAVTDGGDGTWSWAHVPGDDGAGTVTVTASDGAGGVAIDTFEWAAINVDPEIVSLVPSTTMALVGAPVTWTATAIDPGSGDTHVWSFDSGAGGGSGLTTTYVAAYQACGDHGLQAEVRDDDGGADSATSDERVSVFDASVLRPLDPTAVNAVQAGRVVPLRLRVGCEGEAALGLTPLIGFLDPSQGNVPTSTEVRFIEQTGDTYRYAVRIPTPEGAARPTFSDLTLRIWPLGLAGGSIDVRLLVRS